MGFARTFADRLVHGAGMAVLAVATLGVAVPASAAPRSYDGYVGVRVHVQSRAELAYVAELAHDVWTERPKVGAVDIIVAPAGMAALRVSGIPYQIAVADLGHSLRREQQRLQTRPTATTADAWYADFRDFDEIQGRVDMLAQARPDLVQVVELGTSVEGRPLRAIRITADADTTTDKPGVLLTAGQHAREWISVMVSTCIAESVVDDADLDPAITAMLDETELLVVPVVNPDGFAFTWGDDRLWRKNRRDGVGVDLNRNWAVAWGGEGSSGDPESGNYRGTAAFSEPEAAAVRDFVEDHPAIVTHVDFHAFGQLVLYPWGHTFDLAPADDALSMLAGSISAAQAGVHGTNYNPIKSTDLYPAAGNAPDWSYGALGIYAFTIELRPSEPDSFEEGFILAPSQIIPTCEENLAAVLNLAQFASGNEPGTPGDDGNATTAGDEGDSGMDDDGGDGETGPGFGGDAGIGETGSAPTGGGPGSAGGDGEAEVDEAGDGDGCGCRHDAGDAPVTGLLALGLLGLRRRRG